MFVALVVACSSSSPPASTPPAVMSPPVTPATSTTTPPTQPPEPAPDRGPTTSWSFGEGSFGATVPDLSKLPAPVAALALAQAMPGCSEGCFEALRQRCEEDPTPPEPNEDGGYERPTSCTIALSVSGPVGGLYTIEVRSNEEEATGSYDAWNAAVTGADGVVIATHDLFPTGTKFASFVGEPASIPICEDVETLATASWRPGADGLLLTTNQGHAAGHIDYGCEVTVPWEQALAVARPGGPLDAFRDPATWPTLPGPSAPVVQTIVERGTPWDLTLEGAEAAPDDVRAAGLALACRTIRGAACAVPLRDLAQQVDGGPMGNAAIVRISRDGSGWTLSALGPGGEELATEQLVAP